MLSEPKKKVLELVRENYSTTQICQKLNLSPNTVFTHLRQMLASGHLKKREYQNPYELTPKGELDLWGEESL